MTRPTILDRDDVAVVPVGPTPEMENAFDRDFCDWFEERIEDKWHLWCAMLSASPHSSAWQEVRKAYDALERKEARASASLTGLLDALAHHTGERHGIMAIRHLVDRIAALELRLAEAERVMEPFAAVAENDIGEDEYDDDVFRPISAKNARAQLISVGHIRAARAWKEGK